LVAWAQGPIIDYLSAYAEAGQPQSSKPTLRASLRRWPPVSAWR